MTEITINEAREMMHGLEPKTGYSIAQYAGAGLIRAARKQSGKTGAWLLDRDYIEAAVKWRRSVVSLLEMQNADQVFSKLPDFEKKQCRRKIASELHEIPASSSEPEYSLLFQGPFYDMEHADEVRRIINAAASSYQNRLNMIPAAEAADMLGVSAYQIKQSLKTGSLVGTRIGGDVYIDANEIRKIIEEKQAYVGIYDFVLEILRNNPSLIFDPECRTNRAALSVRLRQSELKPFLVTWDQAGFRDDRKNSLYFPARLCDKAESIIIPYLKQFGNSEERVRQYWENPYWASHPVTRDILRDFSETKIDVGMAALLETIIETDVPEITLCTNSDIDRLTEYVTNAPTQIYSLYLARFLSYVQSRYDCGWSKSIRYSRNNREVKVNINTEPYSDVQYLMGAYMFFSDDYIQTHQLYQKALDNYDYALIWLKCIWGYIAAWRTSDIIRMPIVSMPFSPEEIRAKILSGKYKQDAEVVSFRLEKEINARKRRPHKTKDKQNSEYLTVVFPESLREVIGTVYSICVIHSDGKQFSQLREYVSEYEKFWGADYTRVFGQTTFSIRRANKSFLNKIAAITERRNGVENKVQGYAVASFARAHTGGWNKLANVTSRYLECKLDGLSVNDILMLLFDTGTCSFVPYMLLDAVYGENFRTLPADRQNRIIQMAGLTAYTAETFSLTVQHAYFHSEQIVNQLFRQYQGVPGSGALATQALSAIISREAACRESGCGCILAALRKPCAYRGKDGGFGCPYALYQRGMLFSAIEKVNNQYLMLRSARTEGERDKLTGLLNGIYLPAIFEVLSFCKETYHMDVTAYVKQIQKIMDERGISDADF